MYRDAGQERRYEREREEGRRGSAEWEREEKGDNDVEEHSAMLDVSLSNRAQGEQ